MGTEQLVAVADAGPIIHLAEIDCLDLLAQFSQLHIPSAVISEIAGKTSGLPETLFSLTNLQHHDLPQSLVLTYVNVMSLDSLQAGEQNCLYACSLLGVSTILTDDLAARRAAKKIGFTPVGTLGIIVRAYRHQRIPLQKAEQCLLNLSKFSTLFVTKTLIDIAIEDLQK